MVQKRRSGKLISRSRFGVQMTQYKG